VVRYVDSYLQRRRAYRILNADDEGAVMKILVTGSAGFIGFHLSKKLLDLGYTVIGVDSFNDYYDPRLKEKRTELLSVYEQYTCTRMNIADTQQLLELCEKEGFNIIIHLAAQAGVRYSLENPRAYIDSNIEGFFSILEAARQYPVEHLIYASSSSVYGNNTKTPFSEDDKTDTPVSLYAATKKSNELLAYTYSKLYNIPATGLRFFTVYGPWGRPDMAYYSFTEAILSGKPINVFNHGKLSRDFTYIDDIINGIVSLIPLAPEEPKVYNIGNNTPVQLIEFIETLEDLLGKKAEKKMLPMQKGDVLTTYADIDALQKATGYTPSTSIREGLSKFVDWYLGYTQQS
jgi:UDP-glucuronate 4-epimerase